MTASNVVFLFVLVAAIAFFSYNAQRLVRYLRVGRSEDRTNRPLRRLWNVLTIGIAQTKIVQGRRAQFKREALNLLVNPQG